MRAGGGRGAVDAEDALVDVPDTGPSLTSFVELSQRVQCRNHLLAFGSVRERLGLKLAARSGQFRVKGSSLLSARFAECLSLLSLQLPEHKHALYIPSPAMMSA